MEKFEKKMITLFILALSTTIILSIVISDYLVGKRLQEQKQFYDEIINKIGELNKNYAQQTEQMQNNILTLQQQLSKNPQQKTTIINSSSKNNDDDYILRDNLMKVLNDMYSANEKARAEWAKQQEELLRQAYLNGYKSRSPRTIYISTIGISG